MRGIEVRIRTDMMTSDEAAVLCEVPWGTDLNEVAKFVLSTWGVNVDEGLFEPDWEGAFQLDSGRIYFDICINT